MRLWLSPHTQHLPPRSADRAPGLHPHRGQCNVARSCGGLGPWRTIMPLNSGNIANFRCATADCTSEHTSLIMRAQRTPWGATSTGETRATWSDRKISSLTRKTTLRPCQQGQCILRSLMPDGCLRLALRVSHVVPYHIDPVRCAAFSDVVQKRRDRGPRTHLERDTVAMPLTCGITRGKRP